MKSLNITEKWFHCSSAYAAPPPPEVIAYEPPTIPSFFVSGASPDHLTQRYLVEYVLADISDQAVALASKAEEKGDQSELLVIHVSSWDNESRRWTAKLPTKESALDVLVSQELVFLVTEKRNIRVFSLTGTQRHIITHPSPILTTACFGSNIAVCSISGGDYYEKGKHYEKPNFQHFVTIYNVDGRQWYRKKNTVTSVDVPVAKREHLVWLAFTNYGQLVSMDSSYTIRLLSPAGFWLPIFDGSHEVAGKSDAIWPIAVTEGRQRQIRYLYCKGSKYPLIAVKMAPLITTWALPYCAPVSIELLKFVSFKGENLHNFLTRN
ncbi:unnamed protein product [Cylicostephanus goldi]|uniref:WDHD1/CFT4 second beta-propeller domain-containing protein n=1 Tax=Cylicostephanus goldi TaxID=71465 RepID=A0A3P7QKQ5_CYLGO|nr:unnamed protein product [Cylicostephanus goldi]